jgi:hypothetical protein
LISEFVVTHVSPPENKAKPVLRFPNNLFDPRAAKGSSIAAIATIPAADHFQGPGAFQNLPNVYGVAERWVGSCREFLDRVRIFSGDHLLPIFKRQSFLLSQRSYARRSRKGHAGEAADDDQAHQEAIANSPLIIMRSGIIKEWKISCCFLERKSAGDPARSHAASMFPAREKDRLPLGWRLELVVEIGPKMKLHIPVTSTH